MATTKQRMRYFEEKTNRMLAFFDTQVKNYSITERKWIIEGKAPMLPEESIRKVIASGVHFVHYEYLFDLSECRAILDRQAINAIKAFKNLKVERDRRIDRIMLRTHVDLEEELRAFEQLVNEKIQHYNKEPL